MQAWIREEGELAHALLWASGEYLPLAFEKASNPNYCIGGGGGGEVKMRKNNQHLEKAASEALLDTLPLPVLNC